MTHLVSRDQTINLSPGDQHNYHSEAVPSFVFNCPEKKEQNAVLRRMLYAPEAWVKWIGNLLGVC